MTSNFVLASVRIHAGWFLAVLVQVHYIDYPLEVKKSSTSKDDKICFVVTQCWVTWSFCLARLLNCLSTGSLGMIVKNRIKFRQPFSPFFPTLYGRRNRAGLESRAFLNYYYYYFAIVWESKPINLNLDERKPPLPPPMACTSTLSFIKKKNKKKDLASLPTPPFDAAAHSVSYSGIK